METFLVLFVSMNLNITFAPHLMVQHMETVIDDKKLRVLEGAGKLILKYGVKSMTMDDIARELGISKKTLYQYCSDKNDLIKQIIDLDMQMDCASMDSIFEKS